MLFLTAKAIYVFVFPCRGCNGFSHRNWCAGEPSFMASGVTESPFELCIRMSAPSGTEERESSVRLSFCLCVCVCMGENLSFVCSQYGTEADVSNDCHTCQCLTSMLLSTVFPGD